MSYISTFISFEINAFFQGVDFDQDFNPEEHDKKMQSLFNEEFYDAGGDEEEKPEFPDLDKELDLGMY